MESFRHIIGILITIQDRTFKSQVHEVKKLLESQSTTFHRVDHIGYSKDAHHANISKIITIDVYGPCEVKDS